jgi:hypothetical protein
MWTILKSRKAALASFFAGILAVSAWALFSSCALPGGSRSAGGPLTATELPASEGLSPATPHVIADHDVPGTSLFEGHTLGPAKVLGNLTVFAVYARTQEDIGEVLSLDEALERGLAEVREIGSEQGSTNAVQEQEQGRHGARAQVNKLVLENKGNLPILVLAGTIVKGGKQDRQIGQDFLVEAKKTEPVDAFCVEHGRWNAEREGAATDGKFRSAKVLAVGDVRAAGQYANNQSEVWNKVAETNKKHGKSAPSDTLLATIDDAEVQKKRAALAAEVKAHLQGAPQPADVVGMAYAVSGKVRGVRTFMSHRIFRSYVDVLANTAALEAITAAANGDPADAPKVDAAAVVAFVKAIESGSRSERDTSAGNANSYYDHAVGYGSMAVLKSAAKAQPAAPPAAEAAAAATATASPAATSTGASKPKAITRDFLSK